MRKTIILSLFLAPLFFACSKSNSGSDYHMTATVDGSSKNFNTALIATKQSVGNGYTLAIVGVLSPLTGESMELTLTGLKTPIAAGNFSDTASSYDVEAIYSSTAATNYTAGATVVSAAKITSTTIANHFNLVITSVDSVSIKGSFSGDFYLSSIVPGSKKTISSGEFYAKFQ